MRVCLVSLSTTKLIMIYCTLGLHAMHDCGWVHRDISSGNIIIGLEQGPDGQSVGLLIDFDLCKWVEEMELNYGPSLPLGI